MPKLTPSQERALVLLEGADGALDYHRVAFVFAESPEAARDRRVKMQTAQALLRQGLVVVERIKELKGKQVVDRIALATN